MLWLNGIFLTIFTLSLLLGRSCCKTDTLLQGQDLKDGQELVSAFNIFKLKFFKFENSKNWYLGIWYDDFYLHADIQNRAVWIANRNNPILEGSGRLKLTVDSLGRLRISRGASSLLELSSTETTRNTTLKLLDSGNLQLQEMHSNGSMREEIGADIISSIRVPRKDRKAPVWLVVVTSVFLMVSVIWFIIYLVLKKLKIKATVVIRGVFYSIRGLLYFIHREIIPQIMGCIRRRVLLVGSTIDQEALLRELGIDRRRQHRRSLRKNNNELQIFSFESVALATDYFSNENNLGEGGFGSVYKGRLIDGEEVAIKKLSLASGQGLVEFKNEAMRIAKLQHINLVQLIGCCIDKDEKMLIYEYMLNKSLDYFLFDPLRKNDMDWTLRFRIMEGIIQGLLYLHKYSRLKVIHRDIKASKILLDKDMSPKISDFGMARIFGAQESKANTKRVTGTL